MTTNHNVSLWNSSSGVPLLDSSENSEDDCPYYYNSSFSSSSPCTPSDYHHPQHTSAVSSCLLLEEEQEKELRSRNQHCNLHYLQHVPAATAAAEQRLRSWRNHTLVVSLSLLSLVLASLAFCWQHAAWMSSTNWNHHYCNRNNNNPDDDANNDNHDNFFTPQDYAAWQTPETLAKDGDACVTALDCASGSYCAFPSMHNMSLRICCATAKNLAHSIFGHEEEQDDVDPWLTVCSGAGAVGEACGAHDDLCASHLCIHGKCAAQPLPDGSYCDNNSHCQSSSCGFMEYALANNNADESSTNNALPTGRQQCCPHGSISVEHHSTDHYASAASSSQPFLVSYCQRLALIGMACGTHDEICADGLVCNPENGRCIKQVGQDKTKSSQHLRRSSSQALSSSR